MKENRIKSISTKMITKGILRMVMILIINHLLLQTSFSQTKENCLKSEIGTLVLVYKNYNADDNSIINDFVSSDVLFLQEDIGLDTISTMSQILSIPDARIVLSNKSLSDLFEELSEDDELDFNLNEMFNEIESVLIKDSVELKKIKVQLFYEEGKMNMEEYIHFRRTSVSGTLLYHSTEDQIGYIKYVKAIYARNFF